MNVSRPAVSQWITRKVLDGDGAVIRGNLSDYRNERTLNDAARLMNDCFPS